MGAIAATGVDGWIADLAFTAGRAPDLYLAAARATLTRLLACPELLGPERLVRRPGGYGRTLLSGRGAIGVWAIVWSPGAATPVHDHHCSCCFGVVSGALRETWYRPISATHAVATADAVRPPGYVACTLPTGPNLHAMANDGPDEAVSIHVYGYDHRAHETSIDRTYAVAAA